MNKKLVFQFFLLYFELSYIFFSLIIYDFLKVKKKLPPRHRTYIERRWMSCLHSTYVLFPCGALFRSRLFSIIIFMSKAYGSERKFWVSLIWLTRVISDSLFNVHLYFKRVFNITWQGAKQGFAIRKMRVVLENCKSKLESTFFDEWIFFPPNLSTCFCCHFTVPTNYIFQKRRLLKQNC